MRGARPVTLARGPRGHFGGLMRLAKHVSKPYSAGRLRECRRLRAWSISWAPFQPGRFRAQGLAHSARPTKPHLGQHLLELIPSGAGAPISSSTQGYTAMKMRTAVSANSARSGNPDHLTKSVGSGNSSATHHVGFLARPLFHAKASCLPKLCGDKNREWEAPISLTLPSQKIVFFLFGRPQILSSRPPKKTKKYS